MDSQDIWIAIGLIAGTVLNTLYGIYIIRGIIKSNESS